MRYPPSQILAIARALLGKTQAEVSAGCNLSRGTVNNIEHSEARIESVERLVEYYSSQGLQFLEPTNGVGWGVRVSSLTSDYRQKRRTTSNPQSPA